MTEVSNLQVLLSTMKPVLVAGEFVFCTFPGEGYGRRAELDPVCSINEPEGLTLVIPRERADHAEIAYESTFVMITLQVHSSLSAVGLIALVTAELASRGISANVVSGFFHDHVFVPRNRDGDALRALVELSTRAKLFPDNTRDIFAVNTHG